MIAPTTGPRRFIALRIKTILLLVPFAIGVVTITGYLTILSARVALTRAATRILAYKAEQIRDFAYSQWELLVELELSEDPLYVQTAKSAIQSYASSTLRSDTELVFAVNQFGRIELATDRIAIPDIQEITAPRDGGGWTEFVADDGIRVAQVFPFAPFQWTVFTTDRRDSFFADLDRMTNRMIMLAAISSVLGIVIALWFSVLVGRPVEIVTRAMRDIRTSGDLGKLVPVMSSDEIGLLAGEFNEMTGMLAASYRELEDRAESERRAKQETQERERESIIVLAKATEYKDIETGRHLYRVGEMSRMLGEIIGLNSMQQDLLFQSGPLHDVGKIGISDTILLKPGPLDRGERAAMERHAEIGYGILAQTKSRYLRVGAYIAHTHHERWDGSGYPRGLRGTTIPLLGRIVGIVDVLDALTSDRPYKDAWSVSNALDEIERYSGSHFDPRLVKALLQYKKNFADLIVRFRD